MNYGNEWEEIAHLVRVRDKNTCRRCKKLFLAPLNVHHIIPRKKSFDDSPKNLVTLCDTCHKTVENLFKRYGLTRLTRKWIEENETV